MKLMNNAFVDGYLQATQLQSTIPNSSGLAPIVVNSGVMVPILNVEFLGGKRASDFVPIERTLTAGTGLLGGGQLNNNVTFSANIGTGAGQVAAGNDPRIINGQIAHDRWINPAADYASVNNVTQSGVTAWGNTATDRPDPFGTIFTFIGATANGNITSGSWPNQIFASTSGNWFVRYGVTNTNPIYKIWTTKDITQANVNTWNSFSSSYLPLTGGTLTGGLIGTTATFSGVVRGTSSYVLPATGTNNTAYSSGSIEAFVSNSSFGSGARPGVGFHAAGVFGTYLYAESQNNLRIRGLDGTDFGILHTGNISTQNFVTSSGGVENYYAVFTGAKSINIGFITQSTDTLFAKAFLRIGSDANFKQTLYSEPTYGALLFSAVNSNLYKFEYTETTFSLTVEGVVNGVFAVSSTGVPSFARPVVGQTPTIGTHLTTKDYVDYYFLGSFGSWNTVNNTGRSIFHTSGTNSPNGNTMHGVWIAHGANTAYGTELAFRGGAGYLRSLENNVWGGWFEFAYKDWVLSQIGVNRWVFGAGTGTDLNTRPVLGGVSGYGSAANAPSTFGSILTWVAGSTTGNAVSGSWNNRIITTTGGDWFVQYGSGSGVESANWGTYYQIYTTKQITATRAGNWDSAFAWGNWNGGLSVDYLPKFGANTLVNSLVATNTNTAFIYGIVKAGANANFKQTLYGEPTYGALLFGNVTGNLYKFEYSATSFSLTVDGVVNNVFAVSSTGNPSFARPVLGQTPTSGSHLATKDYVDSTWSSTPISADLNTGKPIRAGVFTWANTTLNSPGAGTYGTGLTFVGASASGNGDASNTWINQIAINTGGSIFFRQSINNWNSWTDWKSIWTTNNFTWADITIWNSAVPSSRTITINGVTLDLAANRSWTIGGVSAGNVNSLSMYDASGTNLVSSPLSSSFGYLKYTGQIIGIEPGNVSTGGWVNLYANSGASGLIIGKSTSQVSIEMVGSDNDLYFIVGGQPGLLVKSNRQVHIPVGTSTGLAPFIINSTNRVNNLNVEYLDGLPSSSYAKAQTTLTINGLTQTLEGNRTWTISTGGLTYLSQMNDVSITSPSASQLLYFDGSIWRNGTFNYTPQSRTITINGQTWDLTANRSWTISTGGGGSGTVTQVGLVTPTGFTVTSSPVTVSGNLTFAFASGYSLPTTAKQGDWDSLMNKTITINGFTQSLKDNPSFSISGGGGGGGTVTQVGLVAPTGFTVTSFPVTTSGNLSFAFASGYSIVSLADRNRWDSNSGGGGGIGGNGSNNTMPMFTGSTTIGSAPVYVNIDYGSNLDRVTFGWVGGFKNCEVVVQGKIYATGLKLQAYSTLVGVPGSAGDVAYQSSGVLGLYAHNGSNWVRVGG